MTKKEYFPISIILHFGFQGRKVSVYHPPRAVELWATRLDRVERLNKESAKQECFRGAAKCPRRKRKTAATGTQKFPNTGCAVWWNASPAT